MLINTKFSDDQSNIQEVLIYHLSTHILYDNRWFVWLNRFILMVGAILFVNHLISITTVAHAYIVLCKFYIESSRPSILFKQKIELQCYVQSYGFS